MSYSSCSVAARAGLVAASLSRAHRRYRLAAKKSRIGWKPVASTRDTYSDSAAPSSASLSVFCCSACRYTARPALSPNTSRTDAKITSQPTSPSRSGYSRSTGSTNPDLKPRSMTNRLWCRRRAGSETMREPVW